MAHNCEGVIIVCEDFRLHQRADGRNYIAEFIKGLDCDLITRAGGVQDLARPLDSFDKSMLRDVDIAIKIHNAEKIFLVNHGNCGAYGNFNFASRQAEFEQHKSDLLAARKILGREFPGKEIKLYFAWLKEGTADEFEIKEIID